MVQRKLHVKKGDTVQALSGADRGKQGKILQIMPGKERALVEGLNFIKKHMKATQDNPEGGIIEKEAPIHLSNLRVVKEGAES